MVDVKAGLTGAIAVILMVLPKVVLMGVETVERLVDAMADDLDDV